MKPRKTVTIKMALIPFVLCVMVFLNPFKGDVWDVNARLMKKQIESIEGTVERVKLTDVTPFEWDEVYSFSPYTPKETIYEVVGYKWDDIYAAMSEGIDQIVFLKDGKVVCYIHGYPSNNGYRIYLNSDHHKKGTPILTKNDNLNFVVKRSEKVVYLERIQ